MICLQKILLCYYSTESHCVCTHFSASPSSLTGSYFCKAAFCFVSCFPAFAHTRLSLMPSLPLSHGQGVLPPLKPALLSIPPHSTIFPIMGSALRTLCLFILKDGFPVYYCQTISFNTEPCATCIFFPNRNSLCCSLCLTGTCKLFIDLSCQLSLLSPHAVRSLALFTSCSFSLLT